MGKETFVSDSFVSFRAVGPNHKLSYKSCGTYGEGRNQKVQLRLSNYVYICGFSTLSFQDSLDYNHPKQQHDLHNKTRTDQHPLNNSP